MEKKNMPTEKTMDRMEQILKKIEDGRTVTLEELRSAGFILVVDKDFGRVVNRPHLKKLKGSLTKDGCIEPVSIFFGAEYFEAYPERELTDLNDGDKKIYQGLSRSSRGYLCCRRSSQGTGTRRITFRG